MLKEERILPTSAANFLFLMNMTQITHDLHWLTTSSALVSPNTHSKLLGAPTPAYQEKLAHTLLHQSERLITALASRQSQRLGIYYEVLWQQWFTLQPDIQVLAKNLQVVEGPNTLGEFDLIYQHNQQEIIHREMAVKFYLGLPTQAAVSAYNDWIGPNINDRLDKKMSKFTQQITLSQTSAGKDTLANAGITTIHRAEILLQGYLFYPWQQPCAPPKGAHPNHERGLWVTESDLSHFLTTLSATQSFIPLSKHCWLSPFSAPTTEIKMLTGPELRCYTQESFQQHSRPLLISGGDCQYDHFHEQHRFFVVPNHWLAKARDLKEQSR